MIIEVHPLTSKRNFVPLFLPPLNPLVSQHRIMYVWLCCMWDDMMIMLSYHIFFLLLPSTQLPCTCALYSFYCIIVNSYIVRVTIINPAEWKMLPAQPRWRHTANHNRFTFIYGNNSRFHFRLSLWMAFYKHIVYTYSRNPLHVVVGGIWEFVVFSHVLITHIFKFISIGSISYLNILFGIFRFD